MRRSNWKLGVAVCAVLALSGGVGTVGAGASLSSGAKSPRTLLPAAVKKSGELTAALEIDFPPEQFYQGKYVTGYDATFTRALAHVLGLKPVFINANFNGIIAGLDAGRYDMGPSGFYDTKLREKSANFVDFMQAGNRIAVKKGNPEHITSIDDFCGMKIAQDVGEAMIATDKKVSTSYCSPRHKAAVTVEQYTTAALEFESIITGRADATLELFTTVAWEVKQHPSEFEQVGPFYKGTLYALAVAKNDLQLAKALAAAFTVLMKNGTYAKIMKKWDIQTAEIPHPEVNRVPYGAAG